MRQASQLPWLFLFLVLFERLCLLLAVAGFRDYHVHASDSDYHRRNPSRECSEEFKAKQIGEPVSNQEIATTLGYCHDFGSKQ